MYSAVVLVLQDVTHLQAVLHGWRDAGAPAVTILDSVGTREIEEMSRRDDLPLMPSIRDLLQGGDAPRKTMFTVVDESIVAPIIEATEAIIGDLSEQHKGILFAFPLTNVVGFRGP